MILGDLNYRGVDWLCKDGPVALDAISYEFIELCASYDFTQIANKPTRLDKCPDFILTPDPENVLAFDVHPSVLHGKDHSLVECKWKFRTAKSKLGIPRRNFARTDYIGISNALCANNWKAVFSAYRTINEYWLILYHILQQLIYDYVPMTVIRRHVTNRRHLPKNVRTTIPQRRKAWKRWQHASNEDNKATYDTVSRDCSCTLHRYKAAEEESLLQRNNRCFFNYVSKRLHPKSYDIVLNNGDTSFSTPGDIAQCFADELSKNFSTDIKSERNASAEYVGPRLELINDEVNAVRKLLMERRNSAARPDGIPGIFYKKLACVLAIPLSIIF